MILYVTTALYIITVSVNLIEKNLYVFVPVTVAIEGIEL